jgi:polyhydroxyalkanoate synthesis regulator phasin
VRGDMDGMRKAAESLPFGLGEITKELGAAADEAAKFVMTWLGHDMQGAYDPAATKKAEEDRARSAKAFNEGQKAIADTETALKKATLSAAEFAKVEVDAMGLSADQAEKLLGLKLALIAADERRKLGAQQQALIERGESAVGQAMDQYTKLTMSEKDFIAYEVRHMGLAENHAKSLLNWKLAILQVTEEQALAEKRQKFDVALGESLEAVKTRVAEIRGTMDALAAEQERALKPIYEAVGAGTISFDEAREKTDELKAAFGELRKAQEAATAKKAGDDLTESMRTPEEKARDEIARYKRMLDAGTISQETYSRAVRKSIEEAAATLPDAVKHTIGVRGTFNAMEAAGLGAGGVSDRIAQASEKTAKNTEKIAQVIKDLGLSFN